MTFPFSTFGNDVPENAAPKGLGRQLWLAFLFQGILLVLLGLACIALPIVSTFASVLAFGVCLVAGGLVALVASYAHRKAPGAGWWMASAVISILTGGLMVANPVAGAGSLTILLAAFFIARAFAATFTAIGYRDLLPRSWGWMLMDGLLNLGLAGLILWTWPQNTPWLIGVMVGANLLWAGVFALMIAFGVQSLERNAESSKP
jgi:uncharacterized membrane protein HdeD (DUF308 family)